MGWGLGCSRGAAEGFGQGVEQGNVAGAAAEVAVHRGGDLGPVAAGPAGGQGLGRRQQAGGAEAALHGGVPQEGGGRPPVEVRAGQALDRDDLAAVDVGREVAAGADWVPVHQHRADPAHLDLAGLLGTGQAETVAEEVEQQFLGRNLGRVRLPVDGGLHHFGHGALSSMLHQCCQYSSANSSRYLLTDSSPATARGIGTVSPRVRAMNWIRAARSRVSAVSTAQLMSGPAARMPWLRSSTARPPPSAAATPWPSCGVVTRPAVPSKTGTPSGNSRPSWDSSSRPPAVAPSAIEYTGWVWMTAPTSGRAR